MEIYLGTQGWSYKDWVGAFYPPGTTSADYLRYYARVFPAVELDTTFYGVPAAERVAGWREATPAGFQFAAKVPRSITHDAHLVGVEAEMSAFLTRMEGLEDKLGPILIQLPPDFSASETPALSSFLRSLPGGFRYAVEFRHRSWLGEETYDLLRQHGVAWTAIDLSYMPRHVEITAEFTYIRWLGNRRAIQRMHAVQIDRHADLDAWADELQDVAGRVQRIYGFANNHYSGHSPADIRYLRAKLGLSEQLDQDHQQQGTLL